MCWKTIIELNYKISPNSVQLKAYNDSKIPTLGHINLEYSINQNFQNELEFLVVPMKVQTVLGLKSSVDLGII